MVVQLFNQQGAVLSLSAVNARKEVEEESQPFWHTTYECITSLNNWFERLKFTMSRSYNDELQFLDKIDKTCWRIKKGFVPNMQVIQSSAL